MVSKDWRVSLGGRYYIAAEIHGGMMVSSHNRLEWATILTLNQMPASFGKYRSPAMLTIFQVT